MKVSKIVKAKAKRLMEIETEKYRAMGDLHPEFAAQCMVEISVRMAMGQPMFAEKLMDDEIEDAMKALQKLTNRTSL